MSKNVLSTKRTNLRTHPTLGSNNHCQFQIWHGLTSPWTS
uniref:Uncharacterized protein n=1 Tax=Arundo donax TaxID=35708 RepID=A0A0A9A516_ARUDO